MPTPVKIRVAEWRERKRKAQLVPVEVWVHPTQAERLKNYASRLQTKEKTNASS